MKKLDTVTREIVGLACLNGGAFLMLGLAAPGILLLWLTGLGALVAGVIALVAILPEPPPGVGVCMPHRAETPITARFAAEEPAAAEAILVEDWPVRVRMRAL